MICLFRQVFKVNLSTIGHEILPLLIPFSSIMGYHVLDFKLSHAGEAMLPGRNHVVDGRMIGGSRFSENLTAMQTLPDIILGANSDLDPKSLVDDGEGEDDEEDEGEDTCGRQIDETPELDADSKELNAFHGKISKV